jgi:hypothetical protein
MDTEHDFDLPTREDMALMELLAAEPAQDTGGAGDAFSLSDSTHKQEERAYIFLRDSPTTGLPEWEYTTIRPTRGTYETMVDADEAFEVVKRRNKRLKEERSGRTPKKEA